MLSLRINHLKKMLHTKNAGSFGAYIKVSQKRGVKFLYNYRDEQVYRFDTVLDILKNKSLLLKTFREAWLLKQAESSGISPKRPVIKIFKKNDFFILGIEMEHINGVALIKYAGKYCSDKGILLKGKINKQSIRRNKNIFYYTNYIKKIMKNNRIAVNDLHGWNVFVDGRGKLKLIDFTPRKSCCHSDSLKTKQFDREFKRFLKQLEELGNKQNRRYK